jgi:L-seryl-tRNA(Ser) seleniumtransferase
LEQLDQNKKRENLQKEKNQIFRLLPRVDDLMKKENVQRLAEKEGYERVLGVVRDSVEMKSHKESKRESVSMKQKK